MGVGMSEDKNKTSRRSRLTRVLLVGSLALNLIILGIVGGAAFVAKDEMERRKSSDRVVSPHVAALSRDDRRAVGQAIRDAYRSSEIEYSNDRKAMARAIEILRADTFDAEALRDVIENLDAIGDIRRKVANDVMLERIGSMSAEELEAYTQRLEGILQHSHDRSRYSHEQEKDHKDRSKNWEKKRSE